MKRGHAETYYARLDRTPPDRFSTNTRVHVRRPADKVGRIKLSRADLEARMHDSTEQHIFYTVWLDDGDVAFYALNRIEIIDE